MLTIINIAKKYFSTNIKFNYLKIIISIYGFLFKNMITNHREQKFLRILIKFFKKLSVEITQYLFIFGFVYGINLFIQWDSAIFT